MLTFSTFLIKLIKRLIKPFKPLLPRGVLDFYREFRKEYPLVDRSQVVLYASPEVLPNYTLRQPLFPSSSSDDPRCSMPCVSDLTPPAPLPEAGREEQTPPSLPETGREGGWGDKRGPKVSLIATVKNESTSAREWLESLLSQTRWPDEIVITDGGSTDDTVAILREFAGSFPIPMKVIEAPGAKVARGRNIAIQNATHPVTVCTDFGCVLDSNWLRYLITPFEHDPTIEASSGYSQAIEKTVLDRLCRRFFFKDFASIDPKTFLPSSRSFAMKKSLWEKAGGYPEYLTISGEDTLFDYHARRQPSRWAFVPEARVSWRPPHSYTKLFDAYFRYARGDGETAILAPLYWYKVVEAATTNIQRIIVLLGLILAFLLVKAWAWLLVAVVLGHTVYRFVRHNLRLSAEMEIRFYPVTVLDEIIGLIQAIGFAVGVRNRPLVKQRQIEIYRQRLQEILDRYPGREGIIVYPPTHDWGFMFQRPHQMARTFAHKGYLYIYCTANEITDGVYGFRGVEPYLYLYHGPMEVFSSFPSPIVYIGSPWNRGTLDYFDKPRLIYDQYDDLDVSGGRVEDYEYLLQAADVALVTSQLLLEPARLKRPDVLLAPNGVDIEFIQRSHPQAGEEAPPDLIPIIQKGHPIVGYSGGLATWFDYELLTYLSGACPEMEFVLLGVNYDGSLDRSGILSLENVHWLGMKPYAELFHYVWRFDVAIIPFIVNHITLATSPIKLFEYAACRKPIVSTALPECKRYPSVFIAETYKQFAEHLYTALRVKEDSSYLATLEAIAQENTWENRVNSIIMALRAG